MRIQSRWFAGFPWLILPLVLWVGGCSRTTFDLAGGGRSVYLRVEQLPESWACEYSPTTEQSPIELRGRATWIFWAVPLNHPDWNRMMGAAQLAPNEGIGNLVVESRTGGGDVAVALLTLGFYRSTSVVVRGNRMRLVDRSPGKIRSLNLMPNPEERELLP